MTGLTSKQRWQIRRIFLQRRREYSPTEAAKVLGIPRREIVEGITRGDIDAEKTTEFRLTWRTVATLALMQWREEALFDALGDQADQVLPPLLRLETLTVRMPAYIVRMLAYCAAQKGMSVDEYVRSELHDIANGVRDTYPEIDEAVPGFSDALMFPD